MSALSKLIVLMILSLFTLTTYAIQVDVQTPSNEVKALGFTVNKKKHGGRGMYFSAKDMPAGQSYHFGIRVGGLLIGAKDVPCADAKGSMNFILNKSSTALVTFDESKNTCHVQILPVVRNEKHSMQSQ